MTEDPLIAGRYRRGALVEEGAARVYQGEDQREGSPVFLETPSPVLLAAAGFSKTFIDEAADQKELDHPSQLPVLDCFVEDGQPWLVRPALTDHLGRRLAEDGRVKAELWVEAIAAVLDDLHRRGRVHGAVSADRVLFSGVGAPLLGDSVLARARSRTPELSELGEAAGAAETRAPESIDGELGPAADQYALASLVYRAEAGRWPFEGQAGLALLFRKKSEDAPPLRGPRGAALARALSRDPQARFPSCAAFAEALLTGPESRGPDRPTPRPPGAPPAPGRAWLWALRSVLTLLVLGGAVVVTFVLPRLEKSSKESGVEAPTGPEKIWDLEPWPDAPKEASEEAEPAARAPLPRNAAGFPEVPGFRFLGEELFRCGEQESRVAVYRCLNFAAILGVPEGERDAACEFVLIPKGRFTMGSAERSESPAHEVEVRKAFLLARTELTQAVWAAVTSQQPAAFKDPRKPVEGVSWEDAQVFCRRTGLRLPSEAEWEYAARAGSQTEYFWGETMDPRWCWFKDNALDPLEKGPREVTAHAEDQRWNAFGLVDMAGNVWEWCRDDYIDDYKKGPADERPRGGRSSRGVRVYRGGCWSFAPRSCRVTSRDGAQVTHRSQVVGFRPARSVE